MMEGPENLGQQKDREESKSIYVIPSLTVHGTLEGLTGTTAGENLDGLGGSEGV